LRYIIAVYYAITWRPFKRKFKNYSVWPKMSNQHGSSVQNGKVDKKAYFFT